MRPKLADHRYHLGEPPSRETPCRFRATSPRTCRDPSESIDLDPSDLPAIIVHVMFSRSSDSLNAGCAIALPRNDAASLSQLGAMSYRIVFWSAVGWVVHCLAPYVYALNDLITWR